MSERVTRQDRIQKYTARLQPASSLQASQASREIDGRVRRSTGDANFIVDRVNSWQRMIGNRAVTGLIQQHRHANIFLQAPSNPTVIQRVRMGKDLEDDKAIARAKLNPLLDQYVTGQSLTPTVMHDKNYPEVEKVLAEMEGLDSEEKMLAFLEEGFSQIMPALKPQLAPLMVKWRLAKQKYDVAEEADIKALLEGKSATEESGKESGLYQFKAQLEAIRKQVKELLTTIDASYRAGKKLSENFALKNQGTSFESPEFWLGQGKEVHEAHTKQPQTFQSQMFPGKMPIWCDQATSLVINILSGERGFRSSLDVIKQGDPKTNGHWYVLANRNPGDTIEFGRALKPNEFVIDLWGTLAKIAQNKDHPKTVVYDQILTDVMVNEGQTEKRPAMSLFAIGGISLTARIEEKVERIKQDADDLLNDLDEFATQSAGSEKQEALSSTSASSNKASASSDELDKLLASLREGSA